MTHYSQLDKYYPWKLVEEIEVGDRLYHCEITPNGDILYGEFVIAKVNATEDFVYLTYNGREYEYDVGDELRVKV